MTDKTNKVLAVSLSKSLHFAVCSKECQDTIIASNPPGMTKATEIIRDSRKHTICSCCYKPIRN
jgi:hypothetical protein